MHDNLENYIFYRLVKAIYYGALGFGLFIIFFMALNNRPIQVVDNETSYFTCFHGPAYLFKTFNLSLYSYQVDAKEFSYYDDKTASKACTTNYNPLGLYDMHVTQKTEGSWDAVVFWWIAGSIGSYIILNVIRESIIYIAYGRKFIWRWIKKPIRAFTDSIKALNSW